MSFGNRCPKCGSFLDEVGICGVCGYDDENDVTVEIEIPLKCATCYKWKTCQGSKLILETVALSRRGRIWLN